MSTVIGPDDGPVLVLGATGYVGGRLVPRLLQRGFRVRAGVRSPAKIADRSYAKDPGLEIVSADVTDFDSLAQAMHSCQAVYYLVHSMQAKGKDFARVDQEAATNTAKAAAKSGVRRIIYLGGLGEEGKNLSEHLVSRREVGRILQQGPVPTTFFRAAMILGSGSASFEILRFLVERLPVMITPRWVRTQVQPISIRNVLTCLLESLSVGQTSGQTFDIGGPEVLTYKELFDIYAEAAGLPRRLIIPVPVLSPRMSAYWLHLITPVPSSIARPLIEGLRNRVVCRDNRIRQLIPQTLESCRDTIVMSLESTQKCQVDTCWSDAGNLNPPEWIAYGDADYAGGTVLSCDHRIVLKAGMQELWDRIISIGGENGWYYANWLWHLRGALDRLAGGSGLRRGRRDPQEIRVGDALDFWRVLEVEPPKRLKLLAEMRFPGEAFLEFQLCPLNGNLLEVRQFSKFLPRGLTGIVYWYVLAPFHRNIFRGLLRNLARSSGREIVSGPEEIEDSQSSSCLRARRG